MTSKPLLKLSIALAVRKSTTMAEQLTLEKYSWFAILDHHWSPPEVPDVRSSDESESNISPFIQGHDGETESQRQVRERKNKLKQGRQRRAKQRKEAWIKYESDLAEYNRRKSEREVEEGRAANTPYDKIWEALEELRATSYPNEKQE